MSRVENYFGHPQVSEQLNIDGAHYSLNVPVVTSPELAAHLGVAKVVAHRITSSLLDDRLLTYDIEARIQARRVNTGRGRLIEPYVATDLLEEQIAAYNDFQVGDIAKRLDIDTVKLEERALDTFAVARSVDVHGEANKIQALSESAHLHRETIRHLAVRSFALANSCVY